MTSILQKTKVFLILTAVFFISVYIRFPQLTKEVKSHEQTYILTLQTSEIWRNEGVFNCHFTPMWTYPNYGDKHMAYYKRLEDNKGNNYYVSFPPLSFLMAHIVLLPFNINDGKLILQILNLLLHFLSGFLLYKTVCLTFDIKSQKIFLPAFLTFIVYTFLPIMLFFHTDIFFPEMLGQVMWIAALYMLTCYSKGLLENPLWYFGLMLLFLYTEWIAVFFVTSLGLLYLSSKKKYTWNKLFFPSLIALFFVGAIMFIQFSSIAGVSEMLHSMSIRYLERSGFFGQKYSSMGIHILSFNSLKLFALNIHKALSISGYIIILSFLFLYSKKRTFISSHLKFLIALSVIPVLFHWIVFFNANAIHLLLMARIAVPISILAGIASFSFINKYENKITFKIVYYFLIIAFLLNSATLYQNKFTFSEQNFALRKVAETIKKGAKSDQSVFVSCNKNIPEPEKYLTFMSKRNIVRISGADEAIEYMKRVKKKGEAIIFDIKANGVISEVVLCNLPTY